MPGKEGGVEGSAVNVESKLKGRSRGIGNELSKPTEEFLGGRTSSNEERGKQRYLAFWLVGLSPCVGQAKSLNSPV